MTTRFMDSFDHYTLESFFNKYTYKQRSLIGDKEDTVLGLSFSPNKGRRGTTCLQFNKGLGGGGRVGWGLTFPDFQTTWIIGFAIKTLRVPSGFDINLLNFRTSTTGFSEPTQCNLVIASGGFLQAERNGTVLATSACALPIGVYIYLEIKVVLNQTSGTFQVRINGHNEINFAGNTAATDNSGANNIEFFAEVGVIDYGNYLIDDLYILDGSGAVNKDFLGDVNIHAIFPTSGGAAINWDPSTGSDNRANISQESVDYLQTYNSTFTTSFRDLFHVGDTIDVPLDAQVLGVAVHLNAQYSDVGNVALQPIIWDASSETLGTSLNFGGAWQYQSQFYETHPITGTSWSITDVHSVQVGYSLDSLS